MEEDAHDRVVAGLDALSLLDHVQEQLVVEIEEGRGGEIELECCLETALESQALIKAGADDVLMSPLVEHKLACLVGRHSQMIHRWARLKLAMAGEELALRAINVVERVMKPKNISAYLVWALKYLAPTPNLTIGRDTHTNQTSMSTNKAKVVVNSTSLASNGQLAISPTKAKAGASTSTPPSTRHACISCKSPPTPPNKKVKSKVISTPSTSSTSSSQTLLTSYFKSPQACHLDKLLSSFPDNFDDNFFKELESEEKKYSSFENKHNDNATYSRYPTTLKSHKRKSYDFPWSMASPLQDRDIANVRAVARRLELQLEEQCSLSENAKPLQVADRRSDMQREEK